MNKKNIFKKGMLTAAVATASVVLVNCGSGVFGSLEYPAVAPIVAEALPTSLKPTVTAALIRKIRGFSLFDRAIADTTSLKLSLETIYLGSYGKLSGGIAKGWLNSLLEDMDSRLAEVNDRGPFKCERADTVNVTLDVASVMSWGNADFTFTLPVRCRDTLSTPYGKSGALYWGREGTTVGIWLALPGEAADSGFGYAAKITNYGSSDERVDILYVQSQQSQEIVARAIAQRKLGKFEIVFTGDTGSSANSMNDGSMAMGCFFQLKTDGTKINVRAKSGNAACSSATGEAACFTAADLDSSTGSACSDAGTTFELSSIGANNNNADLLGNKAAALYTLISGSAVSSTIQSTE